jgi:glycosyltransferase involved in cell wall biosynthesis
VLEALALGTPVVATPVAGIDELLGQIPSCIVADRIEPNALADALARFASRPHRDVPEGVVREYDLQPVIQCYVELLHRLTAT